MSTFRNPVGPQPPSVYWRRRLVVGLGLLAVIVVIILIVARPGSGGSSSDPEPTATSTSTPTPGATDAASGDPAACAGGQVTLTAVTDAVSYDPGVQPLITYQVTNTGTESCTIEAGTDVLEYRITSGDDLIWSSKDCQTDAVAATAILEPGVPQSPASIPWDRTRSSTDTCSTERAQVIAGGASYKLNVILGELATTEAKQFLLY